MQAGCRRFDPVRLHHSRNPEGIIAVRDDPADRAEVLSRDVVKKVIRIKVCGELLGSPLVLFDIVKRRFVRTSWAARSYDLSQGTLNPLHMMGLPNRALEPISRSWSFCANDIGSDPAQDLIQATILRIARTLNSRGFG